MGRFRRPAIFCRRVDVADRQYQADCPFAFAFTNEARAAARWLVMARLTPNTAAAVLYHRQFDVETSNCLLYH